MQCPAGACTTNQRRARARIVSQERVKRGGHQRAHRLHRHVRLMQHTQTACNARTVSMRLAGRSARRRPHALRSHAPAAGRAVLWSETRVH